MPDAIYSAGDFSSQARFLFNRFTDPAEGVTNIRALVGQSPRVMETNWLEFKSGLTRNEDIKPHWSKALGAFANSGGGVLIWGIRADRDPATGVDAVQEEAPVADVDLLVSKLKDLQPPATDPPIKGVVIHPLLLPGENTQGFVVCFIPESDAKPHRSEFGKNDVKRFNMRIGDSTQECTVPLLRQLFYPKVYPRIQLEVRQIAKSVFMPPVHTNTNPPVLLETKCFNIAIRNVGSNTVLDIEFNLKFNGHAFLYDWMAYESIYKTENFPAIRHLCSYLHPELCAGVNTLLAFPTGVIDLKFDVTVYSRDSATKKASLDYSLVSLEFGDRVTADCL